mmetsp:Transcript_22156/g.46109  ORF Transcript_22156/g.46109 Transcript_22156/m.46109 type:complete len:140 (+) Transcript_22156:70-489(+)
MVCMKKFGNNLISFRLCPFPPRMNHRMKNCQIILQNQIMNRQAVVLPPANMIDFNHNKTSHEKKKKFLKCFIDARKELRHMAWWHINKLTYVKIAGKVSMNHFHTANHSFIRQSVHVQKSADRVRMLTWIPSKVKDGVV